MPNHPCALVFRALWPRWDRPARLKTLVDFCGKLGSEEVMLFVTGQQVSPGHLVGDNHARHMKALANAKKVFAKRGIDVMVNDWAMLDDFGHADGSSQRDMWPWAVDITGKTAVGYCCLLAPESLAKSIDALLSLGQVGIQKVFLDDEIRHDWHPSAGRPEGAHYCFCPRHLKAFGKRRGAEISFDELTRRLQSTAPADAGLRRQWIAFKRQCMLDYLTALEREVHLRYPDLRIGQMTTFIHFQTLGGIGFGEQVAALAGPLRPMCRPAQGWYGDHVRAGLIMGLAQTLFTISQLPPETEIYSEIDSACPWTQLETSARMSGDFQLKANLLINIKKHSLLFLGEGPDDPVLQRRYLRQFKSNRPLYDALARTIPAGAKMRGVQFLMSPNLGSAHPIQARGPAGDAADPWGVTGAGLGQPPWPRAFSILARSGIALSFDESDVAVLTGGIAKALADPEQLLATRNLIIDGPAAADLQEMGLLQRLGVKVKKYEYLMNERLEKCPLNAKAGGEVLPMALAVRPSRMFPYEAIRGAKLDVISRMIDSEHRDRGMGLVMSEHSAGRRICLLPYDLGDAAAWGYAARRGQWLGMLTFLMRKSPPVWIDDAFEVWPVDYEADGRRYVGLINFGHDIVDDATVWIGSTGSVKFLDDSGRLRAVNSRHLLQRRDRVGIRLNGPHRLDGMDVRLFICTRQ